LAMTQQLYDSIIKRLQEVNLVKDNGGFDAQVVAPPATGWKVAPKPTPIFGLALMCGLLCGLALAWFAESSDKSFRTPEEIRRRLGLPLVGHIPVLAADGASQESAAGLALDPLLCSHHRSKSVEAESFRGVRTALYFSTRGRGHQVVQITSPSM